MKTYLKYIIGFIIGLSIISQSFADYTSTSGISIKSYGFFMGQYTLDLSSTSTDIYNQDIFINWFGTYKKLDSTFCEMGYILNSYDGNYHVICNKMTDYFSPNSLSNLYFYTPTVVKSNVFLPFASGSQAGQDVKALGSDLGTSYLMNFIYVVSAFIGVIIAWFVIKAILKRIG